MSRRSIRGHLRGWEKYGETDAIASLYEGRKGVYLALTAARRLIDTVAQEREDANEIANALDVQRQAVSADLTISVSRRVGEMFIFGGAAHLLKIQEGLFVPSDLTPSINQGLTI